MSHTTADRFRAAAARFPADRPVLVLSHNDADGLAAAAILLRALPRAGFTVRARILGRGENPWSDAMGAELRDDPALAEAGAIVVADLGTRGDAVRSGTPTVVIDHHRPSGSPAGTDPDVVVISGLEEDPAPTSALLAFRAVAGVAEADDLLWLAAMGIVGDMEDKAGFPEMDAARARCGITAIRDAVSLVNAPRRTAAGDFGPALTLLERANNPKELLSGEHPETAALHAAKAEVAAAMAAAKRVAPVVRGDVAIIRLDSGCQIHPLVAQGWRGRLRDKLVIAANTGYRPGWVHFAMRSATGRDLVQFLHDHRPPGAGTEEYGNGHAQATGGALRPAAWNRFTESLGFGAEMRVPEPAPEPVDAVEHAA